MIRELKCQPLLTIKLKNRKEFEKPKENKVEKAEKDIYIYISYIRLKHETPPYQIDGETRGRNLNLESLQNKIKLTQIYIEGTKHRIHMSNPSYNSEKSSEGWNSEKAFEGWNLKTQN